ncbi:MAG TPA: hypothetical protein VGG20_28980 [Thermoanaerobaculia bacterium]|jgi:hypothetical protein
MPDHSSEANHLLHRALDRLSTDDSGAFSPQAFSELKVRVAMYIRALITDSARIAKRRRSDSISIADIEAASDHLGFTAGRRWLRHTGTVGGILLGAALSNFLAMTTANQYNATGVIASAVMAVAGAFAVALHIGFD